MFQNNHYNRVFSKNKSLLPLRGFTAIELLTSIFIAAILATMLSVVFNQGIKAFRQADEIVDIANKAQRFFGLICSELVGTVISQTPSIPFQGNNTNIYFMAPWPNSSDIELCELGYNFDNANKIIKRYFKIKGDGAFEYPGNVTIGDGVGRTYIENVDSLKFRYKDGGTWATDWNSGNPDDTSLPQLVEIHMEMKDSRNVNYTFTTRIFLPSST